MQKKSQFKRYGQGARAARPVTIEGDDKVIRIPFHQQLSGTLTSGAGGLNISGGTLGNRVSTILDGYEFYRVVKLRYRLIPGSTITVLQTLCYYPGIIDSAPITNAVNGENPHCVVLPTRQTVPTMWRTLRYPSLKSYMPWLKTKAGSLDPSEEIQGNLYVTGTGSEVYVGEFEGIIEARSPVDVGSTPARHNAAMLKERERLLQILAMVPGKFQAGPTEFNCKQLPAPGVG